MPRRMKRAIKEKLGWSRPLILSRVRRARFLMALNLVVERRREKEEGGVMSQLLCNQACKHRPSR